MVTIKEMVLFSGDTDTPERNLRCKVISVSLRAPDGQGWRSNLWNGAMLHLLLQLTSGRVQVQSHVMLPQRSRCPDPCCLNLNQLKPLAACELLKSSVSRERAETWELGFVETVREVVHLLSAYDSQTHKSYVHSVFVVRGFGSAFRSCRGIGLRVMAVRDMLFVLRYLGPKTLRDWGSGFRAQGHKD